MSTLTDLKNAVIEGEDEITLELTQQAIDEGVEPLEIISDGLIAGMDVVGKRFKDGEMFVPEVLMTATAMKGGIELVKPLLAEGSLESRATVVMGTVHGDLHDIGKNLVAIMFDSQGYNVIDAGMDVPVEKFISCIKENDAVLVGLSALLTTTMPVMSEVVKALEAEGLRDKVKVIIGGAPVTQAYADEIGADGYSPDAPSAVELADRLLELA